MYNLKHSGWAAGLRRPSRFWPGTSIVCLPGGRPPGHTTIFAAEVAQSLGPAVPTT